MRHHGFHRVTGLGLTALCLVLPAASAKAAGDWEWTIAPYIWAPDISMEVTVNNDPVLAGEVAFSDLLNKVAIGGSIHFEGRHSRIGFLTDAMYVSLSESKTAPPQTNLPGGAQSETALSMGLYEAGGFYRVSGDKAGFDVLFGARILDINQDVKITLPSSATTSFGTSGTLVDGFFGARYTVPFAKRWGFGVRGDVAAGGTEITWNAVAQFGVWFGKTAKYGMTAGWRYTDMEIDKSDQGVNVKTKMVLSGPSVNFVFRL